LTAKFSPQYIHCILSVDNIAYCKIFIKSTRSNMPLCQASETYLYLKTRMKFVWPKRKIS